ncbi:MAG: DUF1330 domain-containing protein [Burkholderiales bacterium]|nr:DUF1330 domain-containing protein [Burkholderiales bacterium]MDE2275514.1 DUF1330 domain-containing protein [Burkholderiales bacterium]
MPAYVIVSSEINDPERFKAYLAAAPATIAEYGGEYLVRGGAIGTLEGGWAPKRLTVLRFASVEQARAWYDSPGYRAARGLRAGLTDRFDMVVVEGMA